jgi:hypothetical protein
MDYIKKYEIGESYSMYDIEEKCLVILFGKPERMRKLEDLYVCKLEDITVVQ